MDDNNTIMNYLKEDSQQSYTMQSRRHPQWDENYLLYRDSVPVNRLTQRQAVNVPIVRQTVAGWISQIDEPPFLTYEARGKKNEYKTAEIVMNEVYTYYYDKLKLDQIDTLEKKIVGLQGRVFKKIGFSKERKMAWVDVIDPYNIEVDPRANMFDLDNTANFLNHKGIFVYLKDILANPMYDQEEKNKLKTYLDSKIGIISIESTVEALERRNERLRILGVHNFDAMGAKDVLVEIKEHYKKLWVKTEGTKDEDGKGKFVWHLIVNGGDCAVLYKKPLKEAIGVDFLPFITWADDPDLNDPWPDGKADSVRTLNKVTNIYLSQMIESRTYQNFGMFFYDNTNEDFRPVAMDPRPFGMYGVPGNPQEIVKQVEIKPLQGTLEELAWIKDMIQSSVAITPTVLGQNEKSGNKTLGAKEINLEQATKVTTVTQKNYRNAWKEFGWKFYEILKANAGGKLTLYKKGVDGNLYEKEVSTKDWNILPGYEVKVVFKSEKDTENNKNLQTASFVMQNFQGNAVAVKLAKQKQLEALGWDVDEIKQVMEAEDQKMIQAEAALRMGGGGPAGPGTGIDESAPPINMTPVDPALQETNTQQ